MTTGRQVRIQATDALRELLGPAEGQYVSFQGEIAASDPQGGGTFCGDHYTFAVPAGCEELCVNLELAGPLADGAAYATLFFWGDPCGQVNEGSVKIYAGENGQTACLTSPAAGYYSLDVHEMGTSPTPLPYTLRLQSDVPLTDPVLETNDVCQPWPPACM